MDRRITNPIQNLFVDIEKIISSMEIKDLALAKKYETTESRDAADLWIHAMMEDDSYLTYQYYWKPYMFQLVLPNVKMTNISYWMDNPMNVPLDFREVLLERGRKEFLKSYVERNTYYRMLIGLPSLDADETSFHYLSKSLADQYGVDVKIPIHQLEETVQNQYIHTKEYKDLLASLGEKTYLHYIGSRKIDLFTARRAKDFEIIKYPKNRSDINPTLLKLFGSLYSDYREYVMVILYNRHLEDVYENYRSFMGMIIMAFTLLQVSNKTIELSHSKQYMDDTALHIILSTYGIPDSLRLTSTVRRKLVTNILKLTREKGLDQVYYDLIDILGYEDARISKLILMRNQTGTRFADGSNINDFRNLDVIDARKKQIQSKPVFAQIDLDDQNPYDTIASGKASIHSYNDIVKEDPTWWDTEEVQKIIREYPYSSSDSKYIMIEATIHQMKYLIESIYFTRMLLDNQDFTDRFMIEVPELLGSEPVSLYDLAVYILAATCMNAGLRGTINSNRDELVAIAGFNFDFDRKQFQEYLKHTKYVDREKIMSFLNELSFTNESDICRVFIDIIEPLRLWLTHRISISINRLEYLEYEAIYRALYTYDATKNSFLDDFEIPMKILEEKYEISESDMIAFQHFYPRTISGEAIRLENFFSSRYKDPFIDHAHKIPWYIDLKIDRNGNIEDRGVIYFHDILNAPDVRLLQNPDGTRILTDYNNGEWVVNEEAVEELIRQINHLPENGLSNAYFQIETNVLNGNGKVFREGEPLPASIRSGRYRDILMDKVIMDILGLCDPPTTYLEYLERKNDRLYELLVSNDRFHKNKDAWMEDVMSVVLVMESELNLHLKYFEQSVVGSKLFFKPLVELINHFKSTFVTIAKTGLKYNFSGKMDAGGNSNMLKLFDIIRVVIHYVILGNKGQLSQIGLYDTMPKVRQHIRLEDRSKFIQFGADGFHVSNDKLLIGSLRLVDEMKIKVNGKDVDSDHHSSRWMPGESGIGRWENRESDFTSRSYRKGDHIITHPVDSNAWKDFVEKK